MAKPGELASVERAIADVMPRRSGQLIFNAPWEKRAFGIAVALCQQGLVEFDELRWRVVAAITNWERENRGREEAFHFYERWVLGLERMLVERGLISRDELHRKAAEHLRPTQAERRIS